MGRPLITLNPPLERGTFLLVPKLYLGTQIEGKLSSPRTPVPKPSLGTRKKFRKHLPDISASPS